MGGKMTSNEVANYYKFAHDWIYNKYVLQSNLKQGQEDAQAIQDFLTEIKLISSDTSRYELYKQAGSKAIQYLYSELLNENFKGAGGGRLLTNLFNRRGGVVFETEFAQMAQTFAKNFNSKRALEDFLVGAEYTAISARASKKGTVSAGNSFLKEVKNNAYYATEEVFGKGFSKNGKSTAEQGKIDIRGDDKIEVNYKVDLDTRIMQLIASSNFSLKNYSSYWQDFAEKGKFWQHYLGTSQNATTEIRLGNTVAYRSLMSSFNEIFPNFSKAQKEELIWHGMNLKDAQKSVFPHWNHLQFIFELTGLGLYKAGTRQKAGTVDFFIYNDPDSSQIIVKYAPELIINQILTDNPDFSVMKTITRINK